MKKLEEKKKAMEEEAKGEDKMWERFAGAMENKNSNT